MQFILTILVVLLLLALAACGLWLLAIRANGSREDFYGLAGVHYAHRGLHNSERGVPENSLRAFRLAARHGYGAELDVHLSKDKRLVVMHDESLARTAGAELRICDASSEQLDRLRLEGTEEQIPYLEEVLPLFDGVQPLVVEIKPCNGNYARLTYRVCKLLDRYPNLRFCIESFDPRVLIWLRRNRPEVIRGQLAMDFMKDKTPELTGFQRFAMTNLLFNFLSQPDFVAYHFSDRNNLSLRLCRLIWKVKEFDWTIQSQEEANAALADGGSIIFEGFAAQ